MVLELNMKLESISFKHLESNWSVYMHIGEDNYHSYITTSVNDMLITSTTNKESDLIINQIASLFEITKNGQPTFHLGCAIEQDTNQRSIKVSQTRYIQSILCDFNFKNCNAVHTPMDPKTSLAPQSTPLTPKESERVSKFPYGAVVGKCMYLSTCTRLYIAYTVQELACFMSNYSPSHVAATKHLL